MVVLGVVGPIAAGKSVVLAALEELGAATIRADDVSREILQPGRPELDAVREAFGDRFISGDGSLRRQALADLIFADADARQLLNKLVHPPMVAGIARRVEEYRNCPHPPPLVAVEAAVLLQVGMGELVDKLLLVDAPTEVRIQRLIQRDGLPRAEARRRVELHDELGLGQVRADYVIEAVGSLDNTRDQVARLWPQLVEPNGSNYSPTDGNNMSANTVNS